MIFIYTGLLYWKYELILCYHLSNRKMVQFYYDYQSWLEEIHFSEHLERTTKDVER